MFYSKKSPVEQFFWKCNDVEDRYFMIPNNVKRLHSMPLTKILGSHKRKQKQHRRYHVAVNRTTFSYVESLVEEALSDNVPNILKEIIFIRDD